jgi:hypothetical protein
MSSWPPSSGAAKPQARDQHHPATRAGGRSRIPEMSNSQRLYTCAKCRAQVVICAACDRGNIYCGKICARALRLENQGASNRRQQSGDSARPPASCSAPGCLPASAERKTLCEPGCDGAGLPSGASPSGYETASNRSTACPCAERRAPCSCASDSGNRGFAAILTPLFAAADTVQLRPRPRPRAAASPLVRGSPAAMAVACPLSSRRRSALWQRPLARESP